MADQAESLSIRGSKGVVAMLISLVFGGGIGATAVGLGTGRDAASAPLPYLSRGEIEAVAIRAAERAEERAISAGTAAAAKAEANAREACDTKLQLEINKLNAKLAKLDQIAEDLAALRATIRIKR